MERSTVIYALRTGLDPYKRVDFNRVSTTLQHYETFRDQFLSHLNGKGRDIQDLRERVRIASQEFTESMGPKLKNIRPSSMASAAGGEEAKAKALAVTEKATGYDASTLQLQIKDGKNRAMFHSIKHTFKK